MVDLNMTEMEPQQTLPQDIDMLPTTAHHMHHHHHHRSREIGDNVFDRVIEALENDTSDSDSEYDSQNRIIHIEADNEDQIHIQIEHGDDNEEDDEDEDENGLGLPGHDTHTNGSSGEDDDRYLTGYL